MQPVGTAAAIFAFSFVAAFGAVAGAVIGLKVVTRAFGPININWNWGRPPADR